MAGGVGMDVKETLVVVEVGLDVVAGAASTEVVRARMARNEVVSFILSVD